MAKDKYALLDTDFISKMHLIKKDEQNRLIDRIMEMPNYQFFCHQQIRIELKRHNISGSLEWLKDKVSVEEIKCYKDEDILDELEKIYGASACAMYANFLKTACEAYRSGYFTKYFRRVAELNYRNLTTVEFLENLQKDETDIGEGNNLGEIKTYVLLQLLQLQNTEPIYVFCSDDRNARSGIVSIGGARCISVLSSFMRLQKEIDFQRADAEPYIQSLLDFCADKKQTTFRVQDNSREQRLCRIPCQQVIDDIYEGKFEELLTGQLKYIQ